MGVGTRGRGCSCRSSWCSWFVELLCLYFSGLDFPGEGVAQLA